MIKNLRVVGIYQGPDGPVLVDCAVRERDIDPEIIVFLTEKGRGDHGSTDEPLHPEFERSDALGG